MKKIIGVLICIVMQYNCDAQFKKNLNNNIEFLGVDLAKPKLAISSELSKIFKKEVTKNGSILLSNDKLGYTVFINNVLYGFYFDNIKLYEADGIIHNYTSYKETYLPTPVDDTEIYYHTMIDDKTLIISDKKDVNYTQDKKHRRSIFHKNENLNSKILKEDTLAYSIDNRPPSCSLSHPESITLPLAFKTVEKIETITVEMCEVERVFNRFQGEFVDLLSNNFEKNIYYKLSQNGTKSIDKIVSRWTEEKFDVDLEIIAYGNYYLICVYFILK